MKVKIQLGKHYFMMKIFFSIILAMLLYQCDHDGGRYISFYNNSGKPVCYSMPFKNGIFYPDTVLPEKNFEGYPYEINNEAHFRSQYSDDQFFLPSDTLSIFFFDPDTLKKYDWQIIREEYKILVRYDFSQKDLQRLKWCIYYPPTEEMKDMKMYPPYGNE